MKGPILTTTLLVLSLGVASSPLAASEAAEKRRESMTPLDLTGFLKPENDARSRSFLYGGVHEHDFSVETAGTYVFESRVPGGQAEDYRVEAVLLDGEGREIARGEGLGQSGGLSLRQRLEPGDYVLRVQGRKYSSVTDEGNSFYITVAGLDDQGRRTDVLDDGGGIAFGGPGRDGRRTAFVRGDDAVAAIAAPRATPDAPASAPTPEVPKSAATAGAPTAPESAPSAEAPVQPDGFDEIVADIKIRARGEVLTFDVVEPGTISITSATFPGNEGTYRIEARVLDEQGRVVAEDKGEGFDGDVDIETVLEPGRYRVWVKGQQFGSAMRGVTNYELRVVQLDTR